MCPEKLLKNQSLPSSNSYKSVPLDEEVAPTPFAENLMQFSLTCTSGSYLIVKCNQAISDEKRMSYV